MRFSVIFCSFKETLTRTSLKGTLYAPRFYAVICKHRSQAMIHPEVREAARRNSAMYYTVPGQGLNPAVFAQSHAFARTSLAPHPQLRRRHRARVRMRPSPSGRIPSPGPGRWSIRAWRVRSMPQLQGASGHCWAPGSTPFIPSRHFSPKKTPQNEK